MLDPVSGQLAAPGADGTVGPDFTRLRDVRVLESDTRYVLDQMLQPLPVSLNLTVRTEQLFSAKASGEGQGLATSRLDYVLYRKPGSENEPATLVGVIEVC